MGFGPYKATASDAEAGLSFRGVSGAGTAKKYCQRQHLACCQKLNTYPIDRLEHLRTLQKIPEQTAGLSLMIYRGLEFKHTLALPDAVTQVRSSRSSDTPNARFRISECRGLTQLKAYNRSPEP